MEIRYVSPDDNLKEISNVYEQSWKYAYKNIIPQSYLDSIPKGHWVESLSKGNRENMVVTENNLIVGTSSLGRSRWEKYRECGEIVSLYLLPEYIGKGYGRALFDRVIKELNAMGFEYAVLWALEENTRARKFYEKYGFLFNGECRQDNIGGKEIQEVMYECRII